jgi:hypothetical protein
VQSIRESLVLDAKGRSSALQAFELTGIVDLKCKFNSPFLFSSNHVALLRHYALKDEMGVPRENGRLGGVAGSVVD